MVLKKIDKSHHRIFIMSRHHDSRTCCQALGSGAITICFNDLGHRSGMACSIILIDKSD